MLPGKGHPQNWANRLLTINVFCQRDRTDMLLQLIHQNRAGWCLGIHTDETSLRSILLLTYANLKCFMFLLHLTLIIDILYKDVCIHTVLYMLYIFI